MKRASPSLHVTRIGARSKERMGNLGRPNVMLRIPAGSELSLAEGRHALFAAVSAPALHAGFVHARRALERFLSRRACNALVLDLRLVHGADSGGLRQLALLIEAARARQIAVHLRSSSKLSLLIRVASIPFDSTIPS
jgi:ABC-type transporter Mla MlaB component